MQLKPEMEKYEWVVIRHPELASAIQAKSEDSSEEGMPAQPQNSDANALPVAESRADPTDRLSPFLSARHCNLNSRNTSMFMAGNMESIIVGECEGTVCSVA